MSELLRKTLLEHPELPVRFLFPSESSIDSDYYYAGGEIDKIKIEDVFVDDERIYFGSDEDEIKQNLEDSIAYDLYPPKTYLHPFGEFTEEQWDVINKKVEEQFNNIKWSKEIVVYIEEG